MSDTLTRRRWAVFEDEDGAFMIVTDTDGDYVTFPEMTEAQCFAAVNEHNALLAHIDALTAAVEGLLDANPDWNDGDLRARLLAILRGES